MNEQLKESLADLMEVPAEQIEPGFDLRGRMDSMNVVSIIALVDEIFGVVLNGPDIAKCESVADLEVLIGKTRRGSAS